MDNAQYLVGMKLADWCKRNGTKKILIPPYWHRANGMVERANRVVWDKLRKCLWEPRLNIKRLADLVPLIQAQMNNMVHGTTGYRPTDLWPGNPQLWQEANDRMQQRRQSVNVSANPEDNVI